MAPSAGRWPVSLLGAFLALVAAGVYVTSLPAPFTFDDEAAVRDNVSIRSLGTALSPPSRGEPVAGRPVANLSFAVTYAAAGLDVRAYRAVNIGIHVLCALLLFGLVRRTLQRLGDGSPPGTAAFACALLWAVHPLTSETVVYISQRTEGLMALCYLATLYCSVRALEDHDRAGRWTVAAVVACAAGMGTKETMVTAPVLVVLYDRVFAFDSMAAAWRRRRALYAGLAATWVVLAALIWSGPRWESAGFSTGVSPWTYLLNQPIVLLEYLRRVLWPTALILDYGEPETYRFVSIAPQMAVVSALAGITLWALIRKPALGFLGAAAFLILAPTSSIMPIATEVGAERRMYLPLAALVVLLVVGTWRLLSQTALLKTAVIAPLVAAVTIGLSAATLARSAEYRDELGLWQSTLDRWPTARAHRNLATLLKRAGRSSEALAHLRESVRGHPEARYALGFELHEQKAYAEAVAQLERFLADYPDDPNAVTAHTLSATALVALERYGEAARHYRAITGHQPGNASAWTSLGVVLAQTDDLEGALPALRRGAELAPRDANSHLMLAVVLAAVGDLTEAARHLRTVLSIDPDHAEARERLARIERAGAASSR